MINLFGIKKIREQDPLKQGLKLAYLEDRERIIPIREQDPLKQGLKPPCRLGIVCVCVDS